MCVYSVYDFSCPPPSQATTPPLPMPYFWHNSNVSRLWHLDKPCRLRMRFLHISYANIA